MVAEDGNFYFRKTPLGTGFSACNCLFDSRNCLLHLWYQASTINWIGQKGPLQIIGSSGHYFTPVWRWSDKAVSIYGCWVKTDKYMSSKYFNFEWVRAYIKSHGSVHSKSSQLQFQIITAGTLYHNNCSPTKTVIPSALIAGVSIVEEGRVASHEVNGEPLKELLMESDSSSPVCLAKELPIFELVPP